MSSIIGNTDFWVGSSLVVIFFWLTFKHQSIEYICFYLKLNDYRDFCFCLCQMFYFQVVGP